jgi:hypothetical protein
MAVVQIFDVICDKFKVPSQRKTTLRLDIVHVFVKSVYNNAFRMKRFNEYLWRAFVFRYGLYSYLCSLAYNYDPQIIEWVADNWRNLPSFCRVVYFTL